MSRYVSCLGVCIAVSRVQVLFVTSVCLSCCQSCLGVVMLSVVSRCLLLSVMSKSLSSQSCHVVYLVVGRV